MTRHSHNRSGLAVPPLVSALLLGWLAAPVRAQTEPGRRSLAAVTGAIVIDADQAAGTRPFAGGALGIRLARWADLEIEGGWAPGVVTRAFTGPLIAFGPPSATSEEIESRAVIARVTQERESRGLMSVGVILHPSRRTRFRPRAFVGLTGHWVRDTRKIDVVSLPPGVTQAEVDRALPLEPPWTRNVGGVTVGAGVEISVGRRVALVPEFRYDYGSFTDEINNAMRGMLRVAWQF
jgi:hypothetical protein